jgi:NADPH:quinone reductase-like Zn-dependent oxidoreductase
MKLNEIVKVVGPNKIEVISEIIEDSESNWLRLIASQISPLDLQISAGLFPLTSPWPITPGTSAVAEDANGSKYFVFAEGVGGGFKTAGVHQQLFKYPEEVLFKLSNNLDPEQVAALMISQLTAYTMIFEIAKATKNENILILGANGSVGRACIVAAQRAELNITLASRKGEPVMDINCLKYEDIGSNTKIFSGQTPNIIIDPIGGDISQIVISIASSECKHILVGHSGGIELNIVAPFLIGNEHKIIGFNLLNRPLEMLYKYFLLACEDIEKGKIHAEIGKVFPLSQAETAYHIALVSKNRVLMVN